MIFLEAIILAIVQGLTEFIPVSSSAHLTASPAILEFEGALFTEYKQTFVVSMHLGTTLAVLIFFIKDWLKMIGSFATDITKPQQLFQGTGIKRFFFWERMSEHGGLFVFIVFACIPAGLVGILFEDNIDEYFYDNNNNLELAIWVMAFMLIAVSGMMFWVDRKFTVSKDGVRPPTLVQAIIVGFAQVIALIPGTSRSGITIVAGVGSGMNRESATKFSFVMSTPLVLGASLISVLRLDYNVLTTIEIIGPLIIGLIISLGTGILAIAFMIRYLRRNKFTLFIIYRIIFAVLLILGYYLLYSGS
jgi:undecaprenyl-diphosphatase